MSLVGNLEDLGLGDILQIVSLSQKSGVLTLRSRNREGKVVFLNGKVVQANSSVFPEAFADFLIRRGVIDFETYKGARALRKSLSPQPTLEAVLSHNFGISPQLLQEALRERIEEVVFSFFGWSDGTFAFELGEMAEWADSLAGEGSPILHQGLNTQFLAIEGSRKIDECRHRDLSEVSLAPPIPLREPTSIFGPEEREASVYDFASDLLKEIGEADAVAASSKSLRSGALKQLQGMVQELNNAALGGGILLLVLRFASEFMNRAVIFMVKEKEIVGLGQFGIEFEDESADVRIRKIKIPADEPSVFSDVLNEKVARKLALEDCPWDNYLKESLGGGDPEEVFIGPLLSEGRVVAILYGDNLPENLPVGETEALEIFLMHAGLTMEKNLLERRLRELAS
ncbi:DUF4388 domain-containing protein [Trichloromonas sp.]|uniref:DUF4388 domain-containing protein n=1 Tax=Trichloromonas sp. TaxID=3069249 RepID=UPI002A4883F6|nr:DUF4388 domain-containing protein [Trichloromonas sp.]